jgi:membrane protease YdiL (CAAX protease family)
MNDTEAGFEQPGTPEVQAQPSPLPAEPPGYLWRPIEPPPPKLELVPPPPPPKLIPNIGHVLVFFLLLIPSFIGGFLITFFALLGILHPHNPAALGSLILKNVAYAVTMQDVWYILQWALAALVFSLWWHSSFAKGIHWNISTALRRFLLLLGIGVVTGLAITVAGNFLPMPKDPEILKDLTTSRAGAWALLAFGVTLAPLTEELAFRGFLLPSLLNVFRWLERKRVIGESAVRVIGIPVSIVLTSIPFALMHSPQVANSWGPVLLIGCVSVILCIVRLTADSVASGVIVHACYNLTLFSGLLYQTDWFRHLDKLKT